MYAKRLLRILLAVAASGLGIVAVPAGQAAAVQCAPPGAALAPVPWAQQLLAQDRVWPMSTGAGQRVAVVGTGVGNNPLLGGQIAERTAVSGAQSTNPDCLGIGTGVAGIIAAQRSDTIGFHGMAPDARILPAKVLGDDAAEAVTPDALAAAINWAVDRKSTVVAVTTVAYTDSNALRQAVIRAQSSGAVVVAATGDVSQNTLGATPYPAVYDGVIGVGAIGQDGTVTQYSRPTGVALVAPGDAVVTTYPGGGVGPMSGTALATGYVAGAVALVRAYRPDLSTSDVVRRMLATATPAPEGTGSAAYGHGIVNPYQAVLDELTTAGPAALPAAAPAAQAPAQRDDRLTYILAGSGAALAALFSCVVAFGARGRRRRWRTGLAPAPDDRPEDDLPEPPVDLFADRR